MHIPVKQFTQWLNAILIFVLSHGFLTPIQVSAAQFSADHPIADQPIVVNVNEQISAQLSSIPLDEVSEINQISSLSNFSLTESPERSNEHSSLRQANAQPSIVTDGIWYYPALYLGTSGQDTVQNGAASGRAFDVTVTGADNLTSTDENSTTEFQGHVNGPDAPGWDLWNEQYCIQYDFGITLNLKSAYSNAEVLLSRIDVTSSNFFAHGMQGRVTFYDGQRQPLETLTWYADQDGQVKKVAVNSELRYVDVCMITGLVSDTPWDGTIEVKYIKVKPYPAHPPVIPDDETLSKGECPVCVSEEKQHYLGDPINTYTGNFNYEVADLSMSAVGQPLRFERSYNSMFTLTNTVTYSHPLGYGWTHNYDINLTQPTDPDGEPHTIILKAPHGSRLRFRLNDAYSYEPAPGIHAMITQQGNTHVITAANQTAYTFDALNSTDPILGNSLVHNGVSPATAYNSVRDEYMVVFGGGDINARRYNSDGQLLGEIDVSVATNSQGQPHIAYNPDANDYLAVWQDSRTSANSDIYAQRIDYTGGVTENFVIAADSSLFQFSPRVIYDTVSQYYLVVWAEQNFSNGFSGVRAQRVASTGSLIGDTITLDSGSDGDFRVAPDVAAGEGEFLVVWRFESPNGVQVRSRIVHATDGALEGFRIIDYGAGFPIPRVTNNDNINEYLITWNFDNDIRAQRVTYAGERSGSQIVLANTIATEIDPIVTYCNTTEDYLIAWKKYSGVNYSAQARLVSGLPNSGDNGGQTIGDIFDVATNLPTGIGSMDLTACRGKRQVLAVLDYQSGRVWKTSSKFVTFPKPIIKLLSVRDPQGNETVLTYTNNITLARVTDLGSQRFLNFDYDTQGRLTSVTDHTGRDVEYGYDTLNNLSVMTDTRDLRWSYVYTSPPPYTGAPHLLHQIIDPDGRTVEKTFFDNQGRAIRQENGVGNPVAEITYLPNGVRVVSENGKVITDTYDFWGLLISQENALNQTQVYNFDASYNRTSVRDGEGNTTYYERDALGLTHAMTQTVNGQTIVTRFTYDPTTNNLLTSTDARNNTTTYTYEGNNLKTVTNPLPIGGTTQYTYNAAGQQTSVTDENGNTTRYGYDALGQRTVITDALGHATYTEYDDVGRVVRAIDAKGKVTLNEYDAGDNLVKVTENYRADKGQNEDNEYNLVTEYTYDGAGRRVTTTDTLGRVSRSVYDDAGRLLRTIQNEHPTETAQNYQNEYNLITEYVYDAAGNQVATIDTLGRETRTEYDELNRVSRTIVNYEDGSYDPTVPDEDIITEFGYDANGNLLETIDVLARSTRTEYDELNRVSRTIVNYKDGNYSAANPDEDLITAYTYDEVGNQKTITDPLGRVTSYNYDDLNRVASIANPLGGTTGYSYDPAGNRTSVTDAETRTTGYAYDALNRVVTTTNALGGQNSVTFDEVGNRLTATDANGHTTRFTYDSLYRLVDTTDAENQTTSTVYNALGNRLSVTDAENNTTTFTYDRLNRVIQTTNPLSGANSVIYDALGNRLSSTDANNHTTAYQYDRLNRVTQTTNPLNQTGATVYDGLGNRLSVTNHANETTAFVYDEVNRLVLTRDPLGNETQYRYDGAGNRVAMIDAAGVETRYVYDALDRLTGVIENYVDGVFTAGAADEDVITQYSYDQVGNRLSVTDANGHTTSYGYDALNRRIELRDALNHTTTYGYDAAGNRTSLLDANGETTSFVYDNVNRLTTIDYPAPEADVTFSYDKAGNRLSMTDGTGTTNYIYDDLYRPITIDNSQFTIHNSYDAVGNRTRLTYPDPSTGSGQAREVIYSYDDGNRLQNVADWNNGQFGYSYDAANRLTGLTLPNGVASGYSYDDAGRLLSLTHSTITDTLASYSYSLDQVGNRRTLTETINAVLDVPAGAYLESSGLVVIEAENGQAISDTTHGWLTMSRVSGYTGTSYLHALPDVDALYQTDGPKTEYAINFTTPGTYTVWVRGYATNAAGDSVYVGIGDERVSVTGFAPRTWQWVNRAMPDGGVAQLAVQSAGGYTLSLQMREDGLRVDRLLLTTDTTYVPTDFGPAETVRLDDATGVEFMVDRRIDYDYDNLYRLTNADYSTGESYAYDYDPVGNRLQQIINGDTTEYLYDAANRLESVDGTVYTFDANGNLLSTGVMTNVWDTANRLAESSRNGNTVQPIYNGVNDRVGQTIGATTTHFALDVQGLPEVIYTSDGESYLHLPGVIMTESSAGEVRYLLSDGLGSVRQAVDETTRVVSYYEFDPYGNPVNNTGGDPYGYTGEWYGGYTHLLHLRARWYAPESGTFLSVDPVESEPPYQYVGGNPVNLTDASGKYPHCDDNCKLELRNYPVGVPYVGWFSGHFAIIHTDRKGDKTKIEAFPSTQVRNTDIGYSSYWNPLEHPYSSDSGILVSGTTKPDPIDIAREENNSWIDIVTVLQSEEVCTKLTCLEREMEQVELNSIGYYTLGPNSNSAAISVLRKCNLPWMDAIKAMETQSGKINPGKYLYLLSPEANSRAENKAQDSHLNFAQNHEVSIG